MAIGGFFDRIRYTFSLMGSSWSVLKANKSLLLFSLLSAVCCILVTVSFLIPTWNSGVFSGDTSFREMSQSQKVTWAIVTFLFYFTNYFVIIFFNSAIVTCAIAHMRGEPVSASMGLRIAVSRLPQIAGWALVSATVSVVLRLIENMNEKVGRFVAGLLGMAWSLMTFLVVPVLVVENKGAIAAFKESAGMLKKTWGEQVVGNFGFGIVFMLLSIPAVVLVVLAALGGSAAMLVPAIVVAVLYLLLLGLIQATLQTIFQAAVYMYAKDQAIVTGFNAEQLGGALQQK